MQCFQSEGKTGVVAWTRRQFIKAGYGAATVLDEVSKVHFNLKIKVDLIEIGVSVINLKSTTKMQQRPTAIARDRIDELAKKLNEPPMIDVQAYFEQSASWEDECLKVAASLHKFGVLIVKDPRVKPEVNEQYIDMVENYFDEVG